MSDPTDRQREYREVYLRSDHWLEVRRAALVYAEFRCQLCNGSWPLDVHHRTYSRLGRERPADVIALCRDCHSVFHDAGRVPQPDWDQAPAEPVVQTAWGVVPEPFAGDDNERCRILETLYSCGLKTAGIVEMTGYDSRLVLGTLYVLRDEGLVEKGPKRRWWITDAGRIALMDISAVSQG